MVAVKCQHVVNEFRDDRVVRAPEQLPKSKFNLWRLVARWESQSPEVFYLNYTSLGMYAILVADMIIIHWLFYAPPRYSGHANVRGVWISLPRRGNPGSWKVVL